MKSFFFNLFSFSRLSRSSYFLYNLFLLFVRLLLIPLGLKFSETENTIYGTIIAFLFSFFVLIISILFIHITIRRLHDLNMSGRCILLKFVPLLGLYIFVKTFFFKGTYGKNRFGPDPFVSDLIESGGESTDEVLHNKINEYYNEIKKGDDIGVGNSDNGLDKKGYQNNNQKSLINILIIVLLIINLIINIFNVISNNAKSAISNIEAMKVGGEENYKKLQKIMNNSMYKANYSKNLDEMASEIKKGNYIDVPY